MTEQKKKHPKYAFLRAYAEIAGYSLSDLSAILNINTVTLKRKIDGQSDFTLTESTKIANTLNRTREEIFRTSEK